MRGDFYIPSPFTKQSCKIVFIKNILHVHRFSFSGGPAKQELLLCQCSVELGKSSKHLKCWNFFCCLLCQYLQQTYYIIDFKEKIGKKYFYFLCQIQCIAVIRTHTYRGYLIFAEYQSMDFVRSYFFPNATLTSFPILSSKLDFSVIKTLERHFFYIERVSLQCF